MKKSRSLGLILFAVFALLQACFEGDEACLDPNALNYDVTGDDNCGTACCNYPSLSLAFLHK
ncbi:MAG: hypothetical protein AAF242_19125, partial [Bacteroidota bacterium]